MYLVEEGLLCRLREICSRLTGFARSRLSRPWRCGGMDVRVLIHKAYEKNRRDIGQGNARGVSGHSTAINEMREEKEYLVP